jgi:hypothetical protein
MLKKFLADPNLDPKSINIHNDFMDYPAIFKTPHDIEDFIIERDIEAPITLRFIQLCDENRLDWTPTETAFYCQRFFSYIYDVYRVPIEQTFINTAKWIVEFNENILQEKGVRGVISLAYQNIYDFFQPRLMVREFTKNKRDYPKIINYITDIHTPDYYISAHEEKVKEQFWIRSSRRNGQPEIIGDEAYMRVWVFRDKVYIFGCDDCSYTVESKDAKELEDFVLQLKCAAPVWNFDHDLLKEIHPKLEFTN